MLPSGFFRALFLLAGLASTVRAQEQVDVSALPMVLGPGTQGFVVYKGPAIPNMYWRCFDGAQYSSIGQVAEEVHLLRAGDLASFTVAYHVEGAIGQSGTCTAIVKVYASDASDAVTPPANLLATYTVPGLPWSTATNHTFTHDVPAPLAVPRHLWIGVEIVAPPGAYGSMLGASAAPGINPAPTVGSTHNLTWFGPASCTAPPGELWNNADLGMTLNYTLSVRIFLDVMAADPIPNGDFETGTMAPWTGGGRYGPALAEEVGVVPPSGGWMGFADTGTRIATSSALAPAGRSLLQASAGVTITALEALTSGGPIAHGSVLTQPLSVTAGEVLSFRWNFLTNELSNQLQLNDSAFFSVSGSSPVAQHLADTFSALAPSSSLKYARETGWQTFSYTFPAAGSFTIGFGAVDRFSTAGDSALLVDTVELSAAADENAPPTCSADLSLAALDHLEPAPGLFVVTEGATLTVPFTGDDPDGEDLMVALSGQPFGATIAPASGPAPLVSTLSWTASAPDKADAPYEIAVTFSDAAGASSTCSVTVVDVNMRPHCTASNQMLESTGIDGAMVTLDGSATDADDAPGDLVYQWFVSDASVVLDDPGSPTASGMFPVGITMATLTVADGRGGIDVHDALITVQDTTPPELLVTTDKAMLWPPKHAMVPVSIEIIATDACANPGDILPIAVSVASNEVDDAQGGGDGATLGDVHGHDGHAVPLDVTSDFAFDPSTGTWSGTVLLRAERAGDGSGRKYTIDVQAFDSNGNASTTSCCVVVPHDRRTSP